MESHPHSTGTPRMPWFRAPQPLIPDLIARNGRWLARTPALIDRDVELTWAELDAITARVARGLAALGIAQRDRVAILMDSRFETAIVQFAILRAGAVAVPLNVSITDDAVARMCADAECVAVVASDRHCARIETLRQSGALRARIFIACESSSDPWIDFRRLLTEGDASAPALAIAPEDECNIIYSSGTTAVPKGIVHTHACRMHWAYDAALALRYRAGCRTLLSLGMFSNITWVTMLATVLVGGTMVILRAFAPRETLACIDQHRITHAAFVPVQLERLLDSPDRCAFTAESLEAVMCVGSPLAPRVKLAFAREFNCPFMELYGLTEGLITVHQPEEIERKVQSVGKPVFGADIRILREDDREAAPGELGEIVGRGHLMMAGYHGLEDANREACWIDEAGEQWLRTGDLGRFDEEGYLYVVDRKKDMIISGGQNLYPADIESVMKMHPAIAEVAVFGVPNERWGETPVAAVVLRAGQTSAAAELIAWTNARLGKQQRISAIAWREQLPRNPNGKVLKRELRREYAALGDQGADS